MTGEAKKRALVVDDDPLSREFLAEAMTTFGFEPTAAADVREAASALHAPDYDLILTDLRLPEGSGIDVLMQAKERMPETPVVVLTAFGTIECAVDAMRKGAEDFLVKPVSPEQIELLIGRVQKGRELERENKALKASLERVRPQTQIVGQNSALKAAMELARRVARTDATVMIRGESGTGKELIAALLHESSPRSKGPFIKVNCAALTESLLTSELFGHEKGSFTGAVQRKEGRFELARGGTLFLDEIGELPLEVQAKLLRVLETGEFERVGGTRTLRSDARVVAATNRDLEAEMSAGRFREDLFFRLDVVPVRLPPLRERREDIPELAERFLKRFQRSFGGVARDFSADAMRALQEAEWPGNVRELMNAIQRAVLVAAQPKIRREDLGLEPGTENKASRAFVGATLEEVERRLILETLQSCQWARNRAAEILGVSARTLSNKIRQWRQCGLLPEGADPKYRAKEEKA